MHQPPRVLIVDDSRATRELLVEVVERAGYEAVAAADGGEALERARMMSPDLVLLDLLMPGMGGAEVLRVLRAARPPEDFLPVICLSVKCDRETLLETLRCGAEDCIAKPWDEEELKARLAAMLRIKAAQDQMRDEKQRLERLAVTDALTGLNNRRFFEDRLREEFRRCQRYGDPMSLVLIDLDNFKAINDSHGHQAGDGVLATVAQALQRSVRDIDVVSRYGGEEFAVILPSTALAGGARVAERIRAELIACRFPNLPSLRLTASLGVSAHPAPGIRDESDLLRVADQALYQAKRTGRDRVCLPPGARSRDAG